VLAVLLACRILDWVTGIGIFRLVTIVAAGLLPLAALLLTEGLLRRHAPFFLKLLAAGGAVTFLLLAMIPERFAEPWRMAALRLRQPMQPIKNWRVRSRASRQAAIWNLSVRLGLSKPCCASGYM
jgi:hypothetical protein